MVRLARHIIAHLHGLILKRRRRARTPTVSEVRERRWTGLEPLEERVLYSVTPIGADPVAPTCATDSVAAIDVEHERALTEDDLLQCGGQAAVDLHVRRELVIVDEATPDYRQLVGDILANADESREIDVIVLDAAHDGVQQISDILGRYDDLDGVHIVSHGTTLGVQLGSTTLTADSLALHADAIAGWGDALAVDADLLLYGCDLASSAEGRDLIGSIAMLTGADVAASDDPTGSAALGGDWDLEYATGRIDTPTPIAESMAVSYAAVLGTPGDGSAIFFKGGSSTPASVDFTGGVFGAGTTTVDVGQWRVMQGAEAPTRDEKIIVGLDASGAINGAMWNGSEWVSLPINPLGTTDQSYRYAFDVAYESSSGDALLTWVNGNDVMSARWDGASWSTPSTLHTFAGTKPRVLHLVADPTSDDMVLTVGAGDQSAEAWVWDGTSFGNRLTIGGAGTLREPATMNAAYEHQSGRALVAYGKNGDTRLYHRVWDGASWSTESATAAPAGETLGTRRIQLVGDPSSNRVAVGVITLGNGTNAHGWVNVWDGSSWGTSETVVTSMETNVNHDKMALAFETGTGRALAV
jgi:hypothetical protein